MIDEERGTCYCGHEINADGLCVVWDRRGNEHFIHHRESTCRCCSRDVRELEGRR